MGKVPANQRSAKSHRIPKIDKYENCLSFSFVHFKSDHSEYGLAGKNLEYFLKLIERLKAVSSIPVGELHASQSKALRCHPIDWAGTNEKNGFGIADEDQIEPMQFSISKTKYGRVMGFFISNVFYIVWLDHDHNVY
jgi:hypothetical protein